MYIKIISSSNFYDSRTDMQKTSIGRYANSY